MGNSTAKKPIMSFRVNIPLKERFESICHEMEIEKTTAFEKIMRYMLDERCITATKAILKNP